MTTSTVSKYYRKINSVYQRDKKGVFIPEFSDPVFEEALNSNFGWYRKWNGTSVGFEVGGEVFGRTEKTNLTDAQWDVVREWKREWEELVLPRFDNPSDGWIHQFQRPDFVYGELVGPGVQGNKHVLDALEVKEFDWRTGDDYFACPEPPLFHATLKEVIDIYRAGGRMPERLYEYWPSYREDVYWEGLVGRTATPFYGFHFDNESIITKIKVEDRWSW